MKKFIIINKRQFGYHTDTYKYTKYLKNYEIKYICFDTGEKKYKSERADIIYIKWGKSRLLNALRFFLKIFKYLKKAKSRDIVFVKNFEFCFLITFFNSNPTYLLDLRTLAISKSTAKRAYLNAITRLNTLFFKHITVITKGVADKIGLSNYYTLPVGADIISTKNKNFDIPRLLYIGTLNNRNIEKVVKGYCRFLCEHKEFIEDSEFHIVGDGQQAVVDRITKAVSNYDTFSNITYHGYKRHSEISNLFAKCNIGISFIPQVDYYDCQIPTKVFEYLLSGLVFIGTKISTHFTLCNETNGIICEDSSNGIFLALEKFLDRKEFYDSEKIRNSVMDNRWEYIVSKHLQEDILAKFK